MQRQTMFPAQAVCRQCKWILLWYAFVNLCSSCAKVKVPEVPDVSEVQSCQLSIVHCQLPFSMQFYLLVFVASLIVDIIPFIGPPAWTVMVFLQLKFHLNIWWVLLAGVSGSTIGRYILTLYI